jgi:hypothetical protein
MLVALLVALQTVVGVLLRLTAAFFLTLQTC